MRFAVKLRLPGMQKNACMLPLLRVECRSELNVTRTQRDKYKTQLEQTQRQVVEVCSNARVAESRCRELDDCLAKTRGECRELRTAEAQ